MIESTDIAIIALLLLNIILQVIDNSYWRVRFRRIRKKWRRRGQK